MTLGGYMGKLLRVDLAQSQWHDAPLPSADVLRRYVGGVGLGVWLLARESPPDAGALDPRTPLYFMTGPLTGTAAPSSANYTIVTWNYDVPYAVATAHSHGFWGAFLKFAGYDGIAVTGQAGAPCYLLVDDGHVELRPAAHLWGKDTRDTERLIKLELGGDPDKISVACIGPAGENLLHGASVKNDRNHGAHKGSVGAVMGSKRLKAIAVRGSGRVPVAHPTAMVDICMEWEERLMAMPPMLKDAGILRSYGYLGDTYRAAAKNLTDPEFGKTFTHGLVAAVKEWKVTPRPSYNCPIGCAFDCDVSSGPFEGFTASLCGGGENLEGAAAMMGIVEPGAMLALADYHDALGIDSAVSGAAIAAAFELFERGVLTTEQTGGLELRWGNYEAVIQLLDAMVRREGLGAILAQGLKEVARTLGTGAEAAVVHVKGGGINMHDWRGAWSVLFGQIVAAAGPCWQGQGVDGFGVEPDIGVVQPNPLDMGPTSPGKVASFVTAQQKKLWEDTLGICYFAGRGLVGALRKYSCGALAQATGWDSFSAEEAVRVGSRVVNLERLLAVRRGFTKADDFDVSPRLLAAPSVGPAAGKSMAPYLKDMVEEYYGLMGWDPETGHPRPETLRALEVE